MEPRTLPKNCVVNATLNSAYRFSKRSRMCTRSYRKQWGKRCSLFPHVQSQGKEVRWICSCTWSAVEFSFQENWAVENKFWNTGDLLCSHQHLHIHQVESQIRVSSFCVLMHILQDNQFLLELLYLDAASSSHQNHYAYTLKPPLLSKWCHCDTTSICLFACLSKAPSSLLNAIQEIRWHTFDLQPVWSLSIKSGLSQ